jgi:hypothetical protein
MLNVDNTADYLLEHGLISIRSILDDDLTIASAARRNLNLKVTRRESPGFLIKQPEGGSAFDHTLRCEMAFYSFCEQEPSVAPILRFLPRLVFTDQSRTLLMLELLEQTKPLWDYVRSLETGHLPLETMGAIGHAIGVIHHTFRLPGPAADPRLSWLRRDVPWVMQVHKPGPELLASISPANYETLKILQTQEGLSKSLDALRRQWTPETMIHNDIKADNILVHEKDPAKISLVDWELVQIGDPAWDIAGFLQDVIIFWVSSMSPALPTAEEMVASARYPLALLQSGVRAFWREYRASAEIARADADRLIERAVLFSSARLIQTAYEMAQLSTSLPPTAILLLQISANLLSDPETSQLQLYGLFQEVSPA